MSVSMNDGKKASCSKVNKTLTFLLGCTHICVHATCTVLDVCTEDHIKVHLLEINWYLTYK